MGMDQLGLLGGLFSSAFLSATLLPGNSEIALSALLHFQPKLLLQAVLIASLGNILGGLTTVWLGQRLPSAPTGKAILLAKRWGHFSLVFSWVPVIGDVLCAIAGWFRWPWPQVILWMSLGKVLRYLIIALLVTRFV